MARSELGTSRGSNKHVRMLALGLAVASVGYVIVRNFLGETKIDQVVDDAAYFLGG